MKPNNALLVFGCTVLIALISFNCTSNKESINWDETDWKSFHVQAVEESLIPVRPGEKGASPFWNAYAKRFIHVPSFDFNEVEGSVRYRYIAISDVNCKEFRFEEDHPRALLSAVWKELPELLDTLFRP